jgi:hypothetical protein
MLCAVMYDFGHDPVVAVFRIHTTAGSAPFSSGKNPHLLFCSRPLRLHSSHLHAASFENWKWKATISFFVLPV